MSLSNFVLIYRNNDDERGLNTGFHGVTISEVPGSRPGHCRKLAFLFSGLGVCGCLRRRCFRFPLHQCFSKVVTLALEQRYLIYIYLLFIKFYLLRKFLVTLTRETMLRRQSHKYRVILAQILVQQATAKSLLKFPLVTTMHYDTD